MKAVQLFNLFSTKVVKNCYCSSSKLLSQQLVLLSTCYYSYSSSSTTSPSKAWASSIVNADKDKDNKTERINSTTIKKQQRPAVVRRRRLEDMSWTTEKMDDKLIWVDCEMTGLDYNKEMIMEIGCVITDPELNEIARQPSVVIHVDDEQLKNMDSWCIKHHGDSGLTESCRQSTRTSEEVDEQLLQFVQKYTKAKEVAMAGNSIYMDRIFIAKQFPKFHGHFHYRNVDVSSIKELVRRWYPKEYSEAPKKRFSHRVLDDIEDSIAELKFYRSEIFKNPSKEDGSEEENWRNTTTTTAAAS